MYLITLLRHGESEGNLAGVVQGQADYPLSQRGEDQAYALAQEWKSSSAHFDLVISSPLLRAAQTAEIVASTFSAPMIFEPAWQERDFGQLQGVSLEEIAHRTPPVDFFHPYEPIGITGESQVDLYARASQAIQALLHLQPGSYLVVSHGAILNKALDVIMGITPQGHYHSPIFHFGNTGYAQFRYNPASRQWAVFSLNNHHKSPLTEGNQFWQTD